MGHRFTEIEDWFEFEEIAPGISRITERYYAPDMRCNIYLIRGSERDLVLDTGLGLGSLAGYLSNRARSPLLVLSHAHYDHIGSAFEFPERLIHPAEAEFLARPTRANTYADLLIKDEDFIKPPWPDFRAECWEAEPSPATDLIREGDTIELGDRVFEVLSTPGHSWGSICLWEPVTGNLFCADTVYEGELFDFLPCSHIPTYVHTLSCLREYPVQQALPGHGRVLTGPEFRQVIDGYLQKNGKPLRLH